MNQKHRRADVLYAKPWSALIVCAFVTACGGGSSDSTGGESGESLSNGSEPRIQLQLTAPARSSLLVNTVSEQDVTVSNDTTTAVINTVMSVEASLTESGGVFQLDAIRQLDSVSPDDLPAVAIELPRQSGSYSSNGQKSSYTAQENIFDALALDGYSLPALTLSHPGTPLGLSASWTEKNSLQSVDSTTVTQVDAISSHAITVSKTIETGTDNQGRYTISGTMTATYALPSVLLTSADINLTIRFEDELYINGVKQPFVDVTTFTQTIREAS